MFVVEGALPGNAWGPQGEAHSLVPLVLTHSQCRRVLQGASSSVASVGAPKATVKGLKPTCQVKKLRCRQKGANDRRALSPFSGCGQDYGGILFQD